ncbi:PD-(D/E)XK nuclease family protein [Fontivita pretiosa]|uniref:PD-(D/E)XK nuclease family protein n=1 Tax=Fontivita pretiosa TaxID=2989684 RepID=UPI003D1718F8
MGVRFVIGRAGSGKSLHCFRSIVEMLRADPLGEDPIYLLVPKQETFSAERDLTCASGLRGFCRARVVSFDLLGEEILSECGGTAIPQITELGRQMIIGHLLRKHQAELKYYASAARQVGLAAELDATFTELERHGRSPADLTQLIADVESGGGQTSPFVNKLQDLRLLYDRYSAYLGQERLDPHRRLMQVLASLEHCKRIRRATVFVDGFLEFDEQERRILAGVARVCRDMTITLLMDPDSPVLNDVHQIPHELSLFHRTEQTYRKLWLAFAEAGVKCQPPMLLRKITRFVTPSLEQIEKHLFSGRAVKCESAQNIELIESPDRRGEVDAAARQIRALVASGMRYREIAVIMRSLEDYHELIDASFTEHEIPYFVDRRRTAAHHPLIQFARAAVQIALRGWPHEAVMALLKSELAGLGRDQVDELENYVLLHRIRGSVWSDPQPWSYRRRLTRRRDSEDEAPQPEVIELKWIDAMRRGVAEKLAPLIELFGSQRPMPLRTLVVELFNTFERFGIRQTLRRWIEAADRAEDFEERGEHEQVWNELVKLLDQMVDVLGDEQLSAAEFAEVLETGLERFDLALTPPTVDQVLVGSIDRTRNPRPRAVILIGMNDNQFPRVPAEDSILSDAERQTLRQHQLDLDPDSERRLLDERLLGYIAFTMPSERLCLIRSLADEAARPQSPSPYWVNLRQQFPSVQVVQVPRESRTDLECIGTPRQLVTALMRWVRSDPCSAGTDPAAAAADPFVGLYHWLATHECCRDAIDVMRWRAWRALSYCNQARLSDPIARSMFSSPLRASVSQLEAFAACPFRHFVRFGLRLSQREESDVTVIDLGNACHGILERLIRRMIQEKSGWDQHRAELAQPVISQLAREVAQDLRGELMLSTAHNQYLLRRIEKTVGQVIDAQAAAGRRGRFRPFCAELTFGDDPDDALGALVIKTPAGNELRLRGKIDRVDVAPQESAFVVIDYKFSGNTLELQQVLHGLSLQLLTYLLVLERNAKTLLQRELSPAAALYVQILRKIEPVKHPDEAIAPDNPLFHLQTKPRGIIDWEYRSLFDTDHTAKESDVLSLYINANGAIGHKDRTDGCEHAEFVALLRMVERKLAELGDRILSGQIDIAPYRLGRDSPCSGCEYSAVCRFDVAFNRYNFLSGMKRQEALAKAVQQAQEGGHGGQA